MALKWRLLNLTIFISAPSSAENIEVNIVLSGNLTNLENASYSLCESIHNKTLYMFGDRNFTLLPYMVVNNNPFYGDPCGLAVRNKRQVSCGFGVPQAVKVTCMFASVFLYL